VLICRCLVNAILSVIKFKTGFVHSSALLVRLLFMHFILYDLVANITAKDRKTVRYFVLDLQKQVSGHWQFTHVEVYMLGNCKFKLLNSVSCWQTVANGVLLRKFANLKTCLRTLSSARFFLYLRPQVICTLARGRIQKKYFSTVAFSRALVAY